jgi:23S rRNA pseudouridine2605 synthase
MAKKKKPNDLQPVSAEPALDAKPEAEIKAETPAIDTQDPIGDVSDGEAAFTTAPLAEPATETEIEAEDGPEPEPAAEAVSDDSESDPEFKPRPPAKLERLQKILAQAGVASRRRAEELIEQGRVQVNGKVVTVLGTKADAARDHIRVDGKLLQGPERLRYFVLNKPRGFVTTVKDPEGRPTVMQFFEKMRERLYPVGRLDYLSEGLLLVTNDGELANRLTRAAAGVEKTYLVKVAGQPTEPELDLLRGGVSIERGSPGSPQVRTSPAHIRQVRQGDNPWYEVVLIEGRNRELRKMFEEIGHFVEKIRRVGYGPLVLDQEPGNLRELDPQELELLRKAADGKLRTPKSKELRRRNAADAAQLPTLAPRPTRPRPLQPGQTGPQDYRPKRSFATDKAKPFRPAREGFRPAAGRPPDRNRPRPDDRFPRPAAAPAKLDSARSSSRPAVRSDSRPPARPAWRKDDRPNRPPSRFTAGSPGEGRPAAGRAFPAKPAWKKPESRERAPFKRPPASRPGAPSSAEGFTAKRPTRLQIDAVEADRPSSAISGSTRLRPDRPGSSHPGPGRSGFSRPNPHVRGEGSLSRPFTTSSGKPRAGGARPGSKPGAPTDRSSSVGWKPVSARTYGAGPQRPYQEKSAQPANRPFRRDESEGSFPPRAGKRTGWKPRPNFSGSAKPTGTRSKPKSGTSSYKGKPPGGKRAASDPTRRKRG